MSRVNFEEKKAEKAFDAIYRSYADSIYKFCLSKLNCDEHYSQDCTQETFMVLYKRLKQGETFENPRAFLYRTALNFIKRRYDEIKKEQENLTHINETENISDSSQIKLIETLDYQGVLKRLEAILNEEEKELLNLRFTENRRVNEIAGFLGISQANCSMRIMRLRKKIITEFKDYM